jgi:hypothetical protein
MRGRVDISVVVDRNVSAVDRNEDLLIVPPGNQGKLEPSPVHGAAERKRFGYRGVDEQFLESVEFALGSLGPTMAAKISSFADHD